MINLRNFKEPRKSFTIGSNGFDLLGSLCETLLRAPSDRSNRRSRRKAQRMTFITDNFIWAASSICDLYKARWAIEVFFKEIKQTLQLSDFIGYNENAVRWQIWTALLTYILLRFIAWQNEWKHTFTRLFTALRGVIWRCLDMGSVLRCCGTASDSVRMRGAPGQAYLPGFAQL